MKLQKLSSKMMSIDYSRNPPEQNSHINSQLSMPSDQEDYLNHVFAVAGVSIWSYIRLCKL